MGENVSEHLDAIEKAMEGVTHGDWYLAGKLTIRHTSPVGGTDGWIGKVNWRNGEANAAYIAACSPDRMREVLALARQAEALQRENAELREQLENMTAFKDIHAMKRGEYSDRIIMLETALEMISAEAKESNEPIGRSVYKALATCGEIADVALLGGENAE